MSAFARKGRAPPGFAAVVEPTLKALDNELRDKMKEKPKAQLRKNEGVWPIHQISRQKTRFVHDLHYKHGRIDRDVLDYCVLNKMIDGSLSNKWLEPGYERLCSMHAVDTKVHQFGTVSICRVPQHALPDGADRPVYDFNGCLGCWSGPGANDNIFGNKYGQDLAEIMILREKQQQEEEERERREVERKREKKRLKRQREEEERKQKEEVAAAAAAASGEGGDEASQGEREEGLQEPVRKAARLEAAPANETAETEPPA